MASDFEKPDKIHTLYPDEIEAKMWPLPVRELLFLGKKTAPKLYNMNIKTIGDLAKFDKELLIKKFGKFGKQMWEYANGIDNSEVIYVPEKPKGIGMKSNVVNVSLRTKDFVDFSHQEKLMEKTDSSKTIYSVAKKLLHEMYDRKNTN